MRHLLLLTETWKMFPPYFTSWIVLACEITFYIMVFVLWLLELRHLIHLGLYAYMTNFWHMLDLINYFIFFIMIILRLTVLGLLGQVNFDPTGSQYSNFTYVSMAIYQVQNWSAINAVLTYLKLFKFLTISRRLSQLLGTLMLAAGEIGSFLIMFCIIFFAYCMAFWMAFGMDLEAYHKPVFCFYSLFLIILGEFDFHEIRNSNAFLGPLLFISYVVLIFFILVNMFVAILDDAWSAVKEGNVNADDPFTKALRLGLYKRFEAFKNISFIKKMVDEVEDNWDDDSEDEAELAKYLKDFTPEQCSYLANLLDDNDDKVKMLCNTTDIPSIVKFFDQDEDGFLDHKEASVLINMLDPNGEKGDMPGHQNQGGKKVSKWKSTTETIMTVFFLSSKEQDKEGGESSAKVKEEETMKIAKFVQGFDSRLLTMEKDTARKREKMNEKGEILLIKMKALSNTVQALSDKVSYQGL